MQWLGKRNQGEGVTTSVHGSAGRAGRASSVAAKVGFSALAVSLRMMAGRWARLLLRQFCEVPISPQGAKADEWLKQAAGCSDWGWGSSSMTDGFD